MSEPKPDWRDTMQATSDILSDALGMPRVPLEPYRIEPYRIEPESGAVIDPLNGEPFAGLRVLRSMNLETIEAAAKLGRKLARLDAEKASALVDWRERLEKRYADKRAELLAGASPEVLAKLGLET